ncbi:MAG: hypothetical protein CL758_04900 [Chloroflexi bacterium]|nr:hypothetical protein [Chloroflexota bacterium]
MNNSFSDRFIRSIDANRTLKDSIIKAIYSNRSRSRISVTDLVSPMQSFYRRIRTDIKPSITKLESMLAGTGFHDLFGQIISEEEFIEQLIEYEGVVGKIDIYDDVPIEIKTTSKIPSNLYKYRSSYFDQLGMYCAMIGVKSGRLIIYERNAKKNNSKFKVIDVNFLNIEKIQQEIIRIRDIFTQALSTKDSSNLPKCEWFFKGCDYKSICNCKNLEDSLPLIMEEEIEIVDRPDLLDEIKLYEMPQYLDVNKFLINDLVFPRKAILKRKTIEDQEKKQLDQLCNNTYKLEKQGFRGALNDAIRFGFKGHYKTVEIVLGSISDRVDLLFDVPTILRTNSNLSMIDRNKLAQFFPHYFDRLAIECAIMNIQKGRLILYYDQIVKDKFMVYDVIFHSRDDILKEAKSRLALLENNASHDKLPKCPSWMFKFCDFQSDCECE